ncbi:PRC-barrel domain-containing protein [Jiella avicenniae]|uniref:PRC-barrel domain-containing protein n=1 Tax=Jiella avicenniae TaxID=2907202 RepID=A0A9X1NYN0_9HYPH|nr:PRC-barrel domain-containing protein [Jiella avicenniae]MCE7026714.1 PRC-barrel domain-containing protein [Jiella avicenniae]
MIRKLLATTAIAAFLTAPALAQDAANTGQQQPAASQTTGDASSSGTAMSGDTQAAASGNYLTKLSDDQYLASNLNGKTLYDGEGEDAQSVGDIQNFLVGSDGKVVAAIVDATVNDESKVVAIPFQQIGWTMGQDNEPRAVLKADMNDLASAPTFQTREEQQAAQEQAATNTAQPAGGSSMATGNAPASGDQMAAQPSDGAMQPADGSSEQSMAANDSGNMAAGKTDRQAATSDAGATDYPATVGSDQYLTENLIGSDIYSGPGDDADEIGAINDLVLASSGQVEAAVVGVGGFLGIGEKDVAVPFDQLSMARAENDEPRITAALDKEALTQAPEFDDDKSSDQMAANETDQAQSNDQMAATTTGAATGAAAGSAMSNAGDQTEQTANNAGQAMDNAGDNAEQTAQNAGQSMDNAADNTQQSAQNTMNTQGDATTTASTGGSQRQGMTAVENDSTLSADDLMGTTVYGPNDESVGDIGDIALNADGQVDAVIVDVGGFLGIGEKPVALGMDNLNFMRDQNGTLYLYTQFTEDQLNNAPEYNKDTYADNRDSMRLEGNGADSDATMSGQPAQGTAQPAN